MKIGKSAQVRRGQEVARQMLNDQKSGAEVLPRYLFLRTHDNRLGRHPYPAETYQSRLRDLTQRLNVTDSMGRPVHISQTHHFRHTRATDLINAGVPIHVVMRYFGRLTLAMTMHYAKTRSEAAEHEFLRYKKFTADGANCPRQSLNRPEFGGDAFLDCHATVGVFSNCIGVSMPRLLCRRCRLCQISRHSKIAFASSMRVFQRRRRRSSPTAPSPRTGDRSTSHAPEPYRRATSEQPSARLDPAQGSPRSKKPQLSTLDWGFYDGAPPGTRTPDPLIKSR